MRTKLSISGLIRTGIQLTIILVMLVTLVSNVVPAAAAPRVVSVSVGAQSGTLTYGTGGNATYVVGVTKGTLNTLTAALSVSGLPTGATAVFSPASLSWGTGAGSTQNSTLTITTIAGTPGGAATFTVRAERVGNTSDFATGNGTLTVNPAVPTITFGPAPSPVYAGSNFTVSASSNSNGALTYSAVSGPCAVVNASLGTFSSSGVGTCLVQANTAATANFQAGSTQQSVAITAAPSSPTITFGAAPTPTYPGADFTVSATTNSDGALTYSAVSGPCTLVSASLGTFSPTGVGACLVQANTAATVNYAAGSAQQSVLILPSGPSTVVDLCATSGTITTPDNVVTPIWGYVMGDCSGNPTASLPAPVITANLGDTIVVTLHNNLPESSAMLFQGQEMVPDLVGAPANGGTMTYFFTAANPGTYLYEAGLLPNAQHQVAMGLYGGLIVRSTVAGQAYNDPNTAYNDEAVILLSEIDPSLNANPAGFDIRNYSPKYFLINGQAYPNTAPINTAAGNNVLLRYVNAGLDYHSMAVLGVHQNLIAQGGNPAPFQRRMVANTIPPGETLDVIVSVPGGAAAGSKFAVYDGNLMLHNSTTAGFGGMLAFITLPAGGPGGDTAGPATNMVRLLPNPTNGSVNVTLSAVVSDSSTGGANVDAAEFFIDAIGANGSGTAMSGAFGSPTVNVTAAISTAQLSSLSSGYHTIYVHGQDALGNWGATNFSVLNLDKTGPASTGLALTPNPSNGSVNVALSATGNDSNSGGSNVTSGEYFIDPGPNPPAGTGTAMAVNAPSPIASLTATISAQTVAGLSEGTHTVSVRSLDSLGNWGALSNLSLKVDKTGPIASSVVASPNPNNGALPYNANNPAVHLTATLTDTVANISTAEVFIDATGANGTGIQMVPTDGTFNSQSETGYADIPLTTVITLSAGNHPLFVHGKDSAGNWGAFVSTNLVIDKTAPTTGSVTLNPTAANNTPVAVSAQTDDTATGNSSISNGEYFIDIAGANGSGTAMTVSPSAPVATLSATIPAVTISALSAGSHTILVRGRDAAGNWSSTSSAVLLVDRTAPTLTSITLAPTSFLAGSVSTVTLTVNGASDGTGSGVTGGEYWLNPPTSTPPAPGGGTQFSGTTANIPVSSLAAGSYTVNARIRDLAGNWSTISTAALTVTAAIPDAIFADGFENPTTLPGNWSSRSTNNTNRLNTSAAAALTGTTGLQAQGSNTNYVQYNFGSAANPTTGTFDARFYFNPHANTGSNQDIFSTATSSGFGTVLFRVRYRWNGGSPQVQIQVGTGNANASWFAVNNNASNTIEVVWQAVGSGGPNPGSLALYVNGTLQQTLATTSTGQVSAFRMGSLNNGGSNILEYFDAFSSKRSTTPLIGP